MFVLHEKVKFPDICSVGEVKFVKKTFKLKLQNTQVVSDISNIVRITGVVCNWSMKKLN